MPKDLFSIQASTYAKYRPLYPKELFTYILQFVADKEVAWDCATGNSQAARELVAYFKKVIATDISKKQLSFAKPNNCIHYQAMPAEQTNFPDNYFNLITVAQAYHWLQFDAFAKEVKRVAKKDAVIAIWGYNLFTTKDTAINTLINKFYFELVGPYWDKERKYVDDSYNSIPFNFIPLPTKNFSINAAWSKDDVIGYLNSWSSVQHFIADKRYNPLKHIRDDLDVLWKDIKTVSFPLFLKLGRVK